MDSYLLFPNHSLLCKSTEIPLSSADLQPFPGSTFELPSTFQTMSNDPYKPRQPLDATFSGTKYASSPHPLLSSEPAPATVEGNTVVLNNMGVLNMQQTDCSSSGSLSLVDHSNSGGLSLLNNRCMQIHLRPQIFSISNCSSLLETSNIKTQMSNFSAIRRFEGNPPARRINIMEPRYCYRRLASGHPLCINNAAALIRSVEPYTADERKERINIYRAKRNKRNYNKSIKYECRKNLADGRTRVRGRFVKKERRRVISKAASSSDHREEEDEEEDEEHLVHEADEEEEPTQALKRFC